MKYPQLVSTRAVNAISDWLVSRLEQLGVEAPQIYTRLLLSLLQTSVQINDPIEFNSLEAFIGNRKGGSIKRYLQCDANTLKKLNAVQCLSEIVSSEQELTTIENLVDELWEKLKDIEKQLDYNYGDEANLTDFEKSKAKIRDNFKDRANSVLINCSENYSSNNNNEKRSIVKEDIAKIELETDPKKRYFNAFPALSKEMEESFRIWRRNAKSLTWPADRSNLLVTSGSGIKYSNSLESKDDEKSVKKTEKSNDNKLDQMTNSSNNMPSNGGLKRKTKRRKSQSMSKGRAISNSRKTTFNDNVINTFSTTGAAGTNRKSNRHMSPTQWDTDFEGYWEMGHDLIKEFFAKQNNKDHLSRSNSVHGSLSDTQTENKTKTECVAEEISPISPFMPPVDISFCCDESLDDEDTFKSISELTVDNSLKGSHRSNQRRLYQRLTMPDGDGDGDADSSTNDVQLDFIQFKAKFNNGLAALWQNVSDDDENANNDEQSLWSAPSNIPWPAVAPIKENLKTFWTNFYNHQFDHKGSNEKTNTIFQGNTKKDRFSNLDANGSMSLPYAISSPSFNASEKKNGSSDFRSMPYNVRGFEKVLEGIDVNIRNKNGRSTPISVFLQDSIWSESLNGGKNTESDESFFLKVWNSNKKLCNLDAINEKKVTETNKERRANDASYKLASYGTSKWSEGINAGPNALQQRKTDQNCISECGKNDVFNQQNVSSEDCVDAAISTTTSCSSLSHTLSSSGVFSGQTPSFQSSFPLQTTTENAKSLTEVYGINSPIHVESQKAIAENEVSSPISLSNHSNECSGFVEYSRIKATGQTVQADNIKEQQRNYQAQFPCLDEPHYPDDENLLTSDRTHFQPIRAYADGYTFDVCSALEVINYNRSDSGYLYYESEKYLEYTRKDTFMAEEENSCGVASAAPLYAGSNCEAAVTKKRQKDRKADELVLKFRVMNREIACQTDDENVLSNIFSSAALQHPFYLVVSGEDEITIPPTGHARSDAIQIINQVVAAAANAEKNRLNLDTPWIRLNAVADASPDTVDPSLIWTEVQNSSLEETSVDEIDFCNESACVYRNNMDQQWSMHEIEKRCQINSGACLIGEQDVTHMTIINAENNNLIGIKPNNSDIHSLWGMCAACNSDFKSAPANNLLRDELKLEADEIMSDLNHMQDLYIGCDTASQGSNDNDCTNDYFWGRYGTENDKMPKNLKHPFPVSFYGKRSEVENIQDKGLPEQEQEDGMQVKRRETQQKVLQQVNKLIADLMRPEKANNNTNMLADAAASAHRELGESLWPDDGEHNIWKQQFDSCALYDKRNSSVFARNTTQNNVLSAEDNKFLAQLTWEHDNLAELWAKSTPPVLTAKQTPSQEQQEIKPQPQSLILLSENPPDLLCSSPTYACLKQRRAKTNQNDTIVTNRSSNKLQTHIEKCQESELSKPKCTSETDANNAVNQKHITRFDDDAPVITSNATYKRLQQFLNSAGLANSMTSAKLKLANRKRRHSASQNYAILHNDGKTICDAPYEKFKNRNNNNNNNNNTKISDLNNSNFKCNNTSVVEISTSNSLTTSNTKIKQEAAATTTYSEDVDMLEQNSMDNSAAYFLLKNDNSMILPTPKQTIITCKYWTTIDPIMDTDVIECTEGTTFSCLVDKNDSILKHVAMLTRPLTR